MYIAFKDFVNTTYNFSDDVFNELAGSNFDESYASGSLYSAFSLPMPNLKGLFIEQGGSLTEAILQLNEDFAEFALSAIQISLEYKDYERSLDGFVNAAEVAINAINDLRHYGNELSNRDSENARFDKTNPLTSGEFGNIGISGNGYYKAGSLAGLADEIHKDSALENVLESIGGAYLGSLGSIFAGIAFDYAKDGKFNASNIAEHVYSGLLKKSVDVAISKSLSALGTTISPIGGFIALKAVQTLVTEALEVATGLDNRFGFGGDLVGAVNIYNKQVDAYIGDRNFLQGLKSIIGLDMGAEFLTDIDKNVLGFAYNEKISAVYQGDKLVSNITNNVFSGTIVDKSLSAFLETGFNSFSEVGSYNKSSMSRSLNIDGFNSTYGTNISMDAYGNVNFNINTRGELDSIAFGLSDEVKNELAKFSYDTPNILDWDRINTQATAQTQSVTSSSTMASSDNIHELSDRLYKRARNEKNKFVREHLNLIATFERNKENLKADRNNLGRGLGRNGDYGALGSGLGRGLGRNGDYGALGKGRRNGNSGSDNSSRSSRGGRRSGMSDGKPGGRSKASKERASNRSKTGRSYG
ncbi:hypothetical protein [Campylobacter pinnipediorum]|uniref:hypothetical protein n=1 Tax=Campylobacter pinnipediorum TaxID=1965231 RepID=UPI00084DE5BF|nr:hypothetical protein [Campylobacter pinnipediorum]